MIQPDRSAAGGRGRSPTDAALQAAVVVPADGRVVVQAARLVDELGAFQHAGEGVGVAAAATGTRQGFHVAGHQGQPVGGEDLADRLEVGDPAQVQSPEPPEVTPWAWSTEMKEPPESPGSAQTLVRASCVDGALGVGDAGVALLDGAAVPVGGGAGPADRGALHGRPGAGDGHGAAGAVAHRWPGGPVVVHRDPGVVAAGEGRRLEDALGARLKPRWRSPCLAAVTGADETLLGAPGHRETDRAALRVADVVGVAAHQVGLRGGLRAGVQQPVPLD